MATQAQRLGITVPNETQRENKRLSSKLVPITIIDGAAAGTFQMPAGAYVSSVQIETPVAIPGTPTNTNLRLGSAANGAQYVADVDIKAQGVILATLLYPGRNPAQTVHFTVASSGGTAAAQDGSALLHVHFEVPAN